MPPLRRCWPLLFLSLIWCPAAGKAAEQTDPTYATLRALRPQGGGFSVRALSIDRDVFRFQFDAGTFQFLTLPDGRAVGAVFVGEGTFTLSPASEIERRHLAFVTGEKTLETLSEPFQSLVLLFTDGTAADIESHGKSAPAAVRSTDTYESFFKKQRKNLKRNLQIRILGDILGTRDPTQGIFLAYVDGKRYPPALAAVDPGGLDWLFGDLGGESSALYVFDDPPAPPWYCSPSKADLAAKREPKPKPVANALHYRIETRIAKNEEIFGTTTIRFVPRVSGLRVLPIHLLGKLRIKNAAFSPGDSGNWRPAAFIQEEEKEDADAAVVFPVAVSEAGATQLRITYEGQGVLRDAGGLFIVEARESWYPNLGVFTDLASFELTYRFPKNFEIVSVGTASEERVEGGEKISVWKQDRPIRVAGFNYGKFKKLERDDKESGMTLAVYTRSPEGLYREEVQLEAVEEAAVADSLNTARLGVIWFGPLPERRVSITQQRQFFFGQSWPALIYLPSLLGVDATTRRELGLDGIARRAQGLPDSAEFVEEVASHEFAHQWWGHLVGWRGYRDQWLSEGFAEFTASLVLQAAGGTKKFQDFWESARRWIMEKPRGSTASNDAAGPIAEGPRLRNQRCPGAFQAMVYKKGAYVLHMLRMLMRDPASPRPDERFIAMMKDFAATYAGKNPSTRDFQSVVERHMVPNMNASGDGRMDWFFDEWVSGTEIPRYREKLEVTKKGGDEYRVSGTVSQEGVSANFRALVHLYVEFPKGEIAHLGVIPMIGSGTRSIDVTTRLSKAPKRALLNAFHDVLSRE